MKLLIVSDIHGNWLALNAVLAAEPGVDAILCLGDLVNYGPHPVECVEWAQKNTRPGWIVQGNHDYAFGSDADPRCSALYRQLAAAMQRATAGGLAIAQKDYLAQLPVTVTQILDGATCVFCHAVPSDPLFGYCPPDAGQARWIDEAIQAQRPDFLLVGHTHLQFIRRVGRTTVVNPGSVGQPKGGGGPHAAYAVWHDRKISLKRAAYDIEAVVADIEAVAPPHIARLLIHVLRTAGELPPAVEASARHV